MKKGITKMELGIAMIAPNVLVALDIILKGSLITPPVKEVIPVAINLAVVGGSLVIMDVININKKKGEKE